MMMMMIIIIIIIITLFKAQWIKLSTVALQVEETTNQTESPQIKSKCWFLVRGQNWSTVPWKIYLENRRELANSTLVWCEEQDFNESRDGVVVKALAFHHCGMDLIS